MNGGRIVDTMLGSFNNHVGDGSVNLAIKMNSHFLSEFKEMRCICFGRRVFTSSLKRH